MSDRPNTAIIIVQLKFLIGGMQTVVWQPEAHQNRRYRKMLCEIPYNRNRPAAANKHSLASQNVLERASRYGDRGIRGRAEQRAAKGQSGLLDRCFDSRVCASQRGSVVS